MATLLETPVTSKVEQTPTTTLRGFTVGEYHQMGEAGILQPDERVELIEGEIQRMSPKGTKHSSSTTRTGKSFVKHLGDRVIVRLQEPIVIGEHSEPEPDVVLAIPDKKEYSDHHPTPQEVLLLLEIADTTLARDRLIKARLYGQAGVIHYCILNLKARELEDYRDPDESGYRTKHTYKSDESFTLVAFPEISIAVKELLPPE
ncbi:MAG TPA: Uma2 family endonuclease [Blastocatellia bacterium]|nr:Uma2 family endonuclease [Blastocatellia bacterium]